MKWLGILLILLTIIGCDLIVNNNIDGDTGLSVHEIEKIVRDSQDSRAVFTYDEYRLLLQELSRQKYIVLPINLFRHTFDSSKVLVGLRHDVDTHPFKALGIAEIENAFNIQSTFYILHSATYYGCVTDTGFTRYPSMGSIYQQLSERAGEIGIHNDLISMMVLYDIDPLPFQLEEIDYYASIGIQIYGSASHGSATVQNLNLLNRHIYSDFHEYGTFTKNNRTYTYGHFSLEDFGLRYEAYAVPYNKYLSESGGTWNKASLEDVIQALQVYQPGDRVQILTHPVWWGKE